MFNKAVMMKRPLFVFFILMIVYGCNKPEVKGPVEFKGPLRVVENIDYIYTENEQQKVNMQAPMFYEFQNGDREFPKGIYLQLYNEFGKLSSTLRANHAYFFKEKNQWRARGKVEVKNIEKSEELKTEELFWKPGDEKIFTEKFVSIRLQNEVIYGKGLDAKQDLSEYTILEPEGEFEVDE
jgi:LPS export ABC transporter protein LptC